MIFDPPNGQANSGPELKTGPLRFSGPVREIARHRRNVQNNPQSSGPFSRTGPRNGLHRSLHGLHPSLLGLHRSLHARHPSLLGQHRSLLGQKTGPNSNALNRVRHRSSRGRNRGRRPSKDRSSVQKSIRTQTCEGCGKDKKGEC